MSNTNLAQVSVLVIAVSMASFFVNADNAIIASTEDSAAVHTLSSAVAEAGEVLTESSDSFTFTSLDSDKDGMLSQQEVLNGKNAWLVKSFKEIDSNLDESITEQELVSFVAKTKAASQ